MKKDDLEDIAYIVYWSVGLDENRMVNKIELYHTVDLSKVAKNEWPIYIEFNPSELFVERAKKQIGEMDWGKHKSGTSDASAHSYVYSSDSDSPVSSNDNSR
jgi:hypothetical protein